MLDHASTRREFLGAAALAACGSALAVAPGTARAAQSTTLVRKNVKTLDPTGPEITQLRNAFRVLESRTQTNPNDPTGWLAQANIHRNSCQHSNWWFFPWHRGYLYYFEQILQAAVQDPTLALPYWDWSDPAERAIPAPFWTRYLYRVARGPGIGPASQVFDEYVDPNTVIEPIQEITDFPTYGGAQAFAPMQAAGAGWLEGSPHNAVHSWIGGAMGQVIWSAQDPIFWLHHANIDRLWVDWVNRHPNSLPTDPAWRNQPFSFYNANGQRTSITPGQVLTTTALNYQYDTQVNAPSPSPALAAHERTPRPPAAAAPRRVESAPSRAPAVIGAKPVTVTLNPPPALHPPVGAALAPVRANVRRQGTLRLAIEGMQVPNQPQLIVRVYLNLPKPTEPPAIQDPHYAGFFTFFTNSDHGHGGHGGTNQFLDVTRALSRLAAEHGYKASDPIHVTLVGHPMAGGHEGAAVSIPFQKVSLTVIP